MNEEKYINRFRWITLVAGSVLFLMLVGAWAKESLSGDWKMHQSEYRKLMLGKIAGEVLQGQESYAFMPEKGIRQVSPPGLHRTDRCITCHLGIENPLMAEAPQPHTLHPGTYLAEHPVERFGCTVCHGGQGRAIDRILAFGEEPSAYWDFPLLHPPYIESSCGKCHLGIFSEQVPLEGTGTFRHGKEVFSREGCLGCHRARGVGGMIGPDLTGQGEKTRHEYSFTNIRGEQTVSNWLKEHFRDPEMVSPGSEMLKMNLPDEEIEALVTFTMGLAKPDISYDYLSVEALKEFRGMRAELGPRKAWSMICSSCHGKHGEGKDYESYKTGVPSVWNYDFIRAAPSGMILFTLDQGRGGRQMASWLPRYSGLRESEIDSLVSMLGQMYEPGFSFRQVPWKIGQADRGKAIYRRDCESCHGIDGKGDIGLPLNNPDFLSVASDRFICNTILQGRKMAGMPAWPKYSSEDLAGLIRYLRSWGTGPVEDSPLELSSGDPGKGDLRFHYLCSRCHGEHGEGGTGPAILNPGFQSLASNRFLYETISRGRMHTAMFGWSTQVQGAGRLDPGAIADIIAFMRGYAGSEQEYIYQGSNPGSSTSGKGLFAKNCARCHGESGEGIKAPALHNQEFLNAASNGYVLATITIGRKGTRMPSWGTGSEEYPALSQAERRDIVAYIRSWQRYRIRK
jgi:mono/diheme cytochrome c family protein